MQIGFFHVVCIYCASNLFKSDFNNILQWVNVITGPMKIVNSFTDHSVISILSNVWYGHELDGWPFFGLFTITISILADLFCLLCLR